MNNLSSTAKKLDKVFEIAHIVLGTLAVASVVGIVLIGLAYVFGWDPESIGTGYESFEVGFLELEIAEACAPDKWLVLLRVAIVLAMTCCAVLAGREGIGCVRAILQPMTEEKPFHGAVSLNLKKLAKISIVLGLLCNAIMLTEQAMTFFLFDLPGLLVSDKITHVSGMFQVDLTFLICWAVFMLLSYVFSYGEQLQRLSDETL